MKLALKYCGGCNPRYDRSRAVEELKRRLPRLSFLRPGEAGADAALVVCGCTAACASTEGLGRVAFTLTDISRLDEAEAVLKRLASDLGEDIS